MDELPDPRVLERVARQWREDARLLGVAKLEGGSSAQTFAIDVVIAGEGSRQLVVNRRPGGAAHEFALLAELRAAGRATPDPLLVDESRELLDVPYLLVELVDGAYDATPGDRPEYARALAEELAAIHAVAPPAGVALPSMAARRDRLLATPSRRPWADKGRVRGALQAAGAPPSGNGERLLHGDYWPCNVLWRDGAIAAVVDWEDAALGEPLADIAITRLDLAMIIGRETSEAFTEAYLHASGVDASTLGYWDLVAALHAGPNVDDWAAGWRERGREDLTDAAMRATLEAFVTSALDRIAGR